MKSDFKNKYLYLGLTLLFVCASAFFVSAKLSRQTMNFENDTEFYKNGWFILFLSLSTLFAIILFFKHFTKLKSENFESYTSHNAIITKIRALSILSMLLFPLTEYYEAVYLNLYPPNWIAVLLIAVISLIALAISFKKNLSFSVINFLPQFSYYAVFGIITYKSLNAGMLPIMAIETACLILFSKLIFNKLKTLLYFLGFVMLTNIFLLQNFTINESYFNIYLSAILQAGIVSIALYLVEGSTNRKVGFGNKILESSNLFVLVADSNAEFVYINPYLEKITGYTKNQLLKNGWWTFIRKNPEQIEAQKKNVIESIRNNQNTTHESTIFDIEGNEIFVSWDNTIIEEKYLLAVGKNITATKQLKIEEDNRKEKVNKYSAEIVKLTSIPYSETSELSDILKNITQSTAEALDIERVSIWTYEHESIICDTLYTKSMHEYESGAFVKSSECPVYFSAISKAQVVNAPDVYNNADTREFIGGYFPSKNIKSLLDAPVFINGQLRGVLCCEQTDRIKAWDNEDVNFVRAVADFVALSIEASKRKELEREYRYILNNAGDIIYTTDNLGNFDFINKTAENLLGYDLAKLKGKHFTSIIHPDFKEKAAFFYLKQFKKKIESTYLEFKIFNSKGEEYWVGQNVKLVSEKNNPGKIKGFQAVVRDINKQKETELALVDSENNFRQLNENLNETFYLYNFEKKRYDYISPNCKQTFGVNEDYFYKGNNYTDEFVLEADRKKISDLNYSDSNRKEYEIEFRVLISGKIRWIRERSFPIKDANGTVIKSSGICSDITENKHQEESLKQLSQVAQSVSNGVVITNANGNIEWCNHSFATMVEYSLEELIGKRPIELFSGKETSGEIKQQIVHNKLQNADIEILQYTKSGKQKWFMITNTPLLDETGKVEKYIEIVTDITERKAMEREYRYILDNAGDVIYTTDANGIVDFLNESITKILGYQPNEIIGKHFTHIIHPEDKKRVALFYLRQVVALREDSYLEFRVVNSTGSYNWVGQNVKLIKESTQSNNIKGFQSILRDITKQKETELALTDSENNFRQISETINDVFYLYNIQDDRYEYMSPNSYNILGIEADYFYKINNFADDYIIDKDRAMAKEAYSKIDIGEPFDIEYRIRHGNEIVWIKEKSFAIRDADGNVIKTSGTYIDVTQKKMQEKHLLKINKELSVNSEDLAINSLLKEQLIYTNDFEEIAKVSLTTLKQKIPGIARGSLFLVNNNNNALDVFYADNEEIKKDTYEFEDVKSYQTLKQGKKFIEYNMDLNSKLSKSDLIRRKNNILSYILLPINYSTELIGALSLEFETPFSLTKREMNVLDNFTSVLPVVVNKINLQKELSGKNKDVHDSLNYAKNIQQSILPNLSHHRSSIKNFMSLYMPKDVVSGDFYVIDSFDEYTVIALGDCTGHGVPGAFITLLGSNFLQRLTVENKITSPAQILESLDYQLFQSLNKNREGTIRDGMELGVCVYNRKNKNLTFAGAGLFLLYYRDNEQFVVQGSKRSIGDENQNKVTFAETNIVLNGTEKFFLFSDGYRDQLGGTEKRKRFSRGRFFDLLHKIKNLPPFQQEFLLKMEHNKHRGKIEQTDDISIIGFELKQ
jgi:PAS domain S-box-containing protein